MTAVAEFIAEDELGREETAEQYNERMGIRQIRDLDTSSPPPLLLGYIAPGKHTILYGEGGTGKGTTASSWVVDLASQGIKSLIVDYEGHEDEWGRRTTGFAHGLDLTDLIFYASPNSSTWPGATGALWELKDKVKEAMDRNNIDVLVVDSLVQACIGVDASTGNTEAPTKYNAALVYIGRTALSLAHITGAGNTKHPFGSVHWHNTARVTWYIDKAPDGISMRMTAKKHNSYPPQPTLVNTVSYDSKGIPFEMHTKSYSTAIGDLIDIHLDGPMSAADLIKRLNEEATDDTEYKSNSVQRALKRGLTGMNKKYTYNDGLWAQVGYEAPLTLDGTAMRMPEGKKKHAPSQREGAHATPRAEWAQP